MIWLPPLSFFFDQLVACVKIIDGGLSVSSKFIVGLGPPRRVIVKFETVSQNESFKLGPTETIFCRTFPLQYQVPGRSQRILLHFVLTLVLPGFVFLSTLQELNLES